MHELSAPGMVFGTIVLINYQLANVSKLVFDLFPPLLNQVHDTICGQFGTDKEQMQLIEFGQKNAIRGEGECGIKIMV
jgi:hypothetical protein